MMDQKITALNADGLEALAQGLALAARLVDGDVPLSMAQVQALYDSLLENPSFEPGIIAAGLAFGAEIIRCSQFEWIRVNDDYGGETCVGMLPSDLPVHVFCAPISMVEKRILRQERWNLAELRDRVIEQLMSSLREHGGS